MPFAASPTTSIKELLPQSLAGNLIAGFPFFGGVFALMLGVFATGSDYGWDTLKTYSLATALGALPEAISSNGPGSFGGPFVAPGQAVAVLAAFVAGFAAVAALVLRRRDVT